VDCEVIDRISIVEHNGYFKAQLKYEALFELDPDVSIYCKEETKEKIKRYAKEQLVANIKTAIAKYAFDYCQSYSDYHFLTKEDHSRMVEFYSKYGSFSRLSEIIQSKQNQKEQSDD